MGTIFAFLKKHFHILLFILLETIALTMVLRFHFQSKTNFFNTSNHVAGNILEVKHNVNYYRGLKEQNNALFIENIELRKSLKENYFIQPKDTFFISDTLFKQRYQYIAAEVIGNSTDKQNNFITINKGRESGIKAGMGVFCPSGVIGRVMEVSNNFALIMSVLNNKIILSPKVKEINLSKGRVTWDGKDPRYAIMTGINKNEPVEIGHTVVTSPYSKDFPENIMIGMITEKKVIDGGFLELKIKLSTNFTQIREAYIVKDLFKEELDIFENKIQESN